MPSPRRWRGPENGMRHFTVGTEGSGTSVPTAMLENGMRHIDNKKTPVDCEQAPDDYHYKISNASLAANAARGMACAIYKTKKYLLIVSKLPSGDIF